MSLLRNIFRCFLFRYPKKPAINLPANFLYLALPLLLVHGVVSHDGLLNPKGGVSVNQPNQKDPKKGMPSGKPTAAPGPAKPQQGPPKKPMGK
jgi:hypothetical protein